MVGGWNPPPSIPFKTFEIPHTYGKATLTGRRDCADSFAHILDIPQVGIIAPRKSGS